jgi:HEPN domain-containing protein
MGKGIDKKILLNWKIKADNDIRIVEQGLRAEEPVTDVLCFHCQQATEKYLKLFLTAKHIEFNPTHNIAILLQQCIGIDNSFSSLEETSYLTQYAVELRYPDDFYIPDLPETEKAYKLTLNVRKFVLSKLKIKME